MIESIGFLALIILTVIGIGILISRQKTTQAEKDELIPFSKACINIEMEFKKLPKNPHSSWELKKKQHKALEDPTERDLAKKAKVKDLQFNSNNDIYARRNTLMRTIQLEANIFAVFGEYPEMTSDFIKRRIIDSTSVSEERAEKIFNYWGLHSIITCVNYSKDLWAIGDILEKNKPTAQHWARLNSHWIEEI